MRISAGVKNAVTALRARYILIRSLELPMPLFDGAIQFLGSGILPKRGSFIAMSTPAEAAIRTAYS
jgi:hypothetical protein